MIYLDNRTGSAELFTPLQRRRLPVVLTTLRFGDLAFAGKGPHGDVMIAVERKRITDLLQSLTSGRLSGHQLPGLVEEFAFRWLLVEGRYRETEDGWIEIPRKHGKTDTVRLRFSALENYLITLTMKGGMLVHRAWDVEESCAWIEALYNWWTKKEFNDHRSHLALHQAADYAVFFRPSLVHRVAMQLPGIDDGRAPLVARKFPTVVDMVGAEATAWQSIPGIGPKIAANVVKALRSKD